MESFKVKKSDEIRVYSYVSKGMNAKGLHTIRV